jgi:putative transposase
VANAAIARILNTCSATQFDVFAYCVMPDHVHVIVEGTSDASDLRRCAKLMKQQIEYNARAQFRIYPLWQQGYYERVLRSYHALDVAIRYVLNNPVRAGLVKNAADYAFSGTPSPVARTFMVRVEKS